MHDSFARMRLYRMVIFWILAFSYILVYFHRLCPAVLAVDMMRDLHASGALIGFLSAAYFYPYSMMQVPAGLLSDSWGPRRTITFFFSTAGIGCLILGFAPTPLWAIIGRIMVGLGVSTLFVSTLKILAEWFHAREFASMTGILMAMGGMGSLFATSPLAALSSRFGWRFSFILIGIGTLVLTLLVRLFVRDNPSEFGWPSVAEQEHADCPAAGIGEAIKKVLTEPAFWPLAVFFFFDCAIFFSFGGLWGGPYLRHVHGLDTAQSGRILAMLAVGLIIGSPLQSQFSNRLFKARKPVLIVSSIVTLLLTALLAFATASLSTVSLYIICLGLGMFTSSVVVTGFTATKELFPVQMAGTSIGIANFFPFAGGAVFQPILGLLLERQGRISGAFTLEGYRQAFLVLFICGILTLLAACFTRETMKKSAT